MQEGSDEFKAWKTAVAAEAKTMTADRLGEFVTRVMGAEHDYGTVCHAVAICAEAAAWAADKQPRGGITGFQAGAVFWEFARSWRGIEGAARLIEYDDALYPQHEDRFDRTINRSTLDDLRAKAIALLAEDCGADSVRRHWQSIVDGRPPFGLRVVDR